MMIIRKIIIDYVSHPQDYLRKYMFIDNINNHILLIYHVKVIYLNANKYLSYIFLS